MTVIQFPRQNVRARGDLPLAVFAHTLPELSEAEDVFDAEWLSNCIVNTTIGLFATRRLGLPVAHLILAPADKISVRAGTNPPEMKALPSEAVFSYTYPSIFSNDLFGEFIDNGNFQRLALFGFAANDVGLVSAIDAAQRDLDMIVIRDCSPLFSIDDCPVEMSDSAVFGTMEYFASVMTLPDFIETLAGHTATLSEFMPQTEALMESKSLQTALARVSGRSVSLNTD